MAANKTSELSLTDDVQVIREILFGEQAKLFKERITSLEESISALKKENERLHKALANEIEAREKATLERVQALEDDLSRRLEAEGGDRQQAQSDLQRYLEEQLRQSVQDLTARQDANFVQQGDLVEALVKALGGYKDRLPVNGA